MPDTGLGGWATGQRLPGGTGKLPGYAEAQHFGFSEVARASLWVSRGSGGSIRLPPFITRVLGSLLRDGRKAENWWGQEGFLLAASTGCPTASRGWACARDPLQRRLSSQAANSGTGSCWKLFSVAGACVPGVIISPLLHGAKTAPPLGVIGVNKPHLTCRKIEAKSYFR